MIEAIYIAHFLLNNFKIACKMEQTAEALRYKIIKDSLLPQGLNSLFNFACNFGIVQSKKGAI